MNEFDLLIDLHKNNERQGPGGDLQTKCAIELSGLKTFNNLKVADIGCGTGVSTLTLAKELNADITAIDLFPEFLEVLQRNLNGNELSHKIKTLACSMDQLPFDEESLDAIWAEGAIYNIGFEKGVSYFKKFLKSGGILATSEITWITEKRPEEIEAHWNTEYPEIATASEKIKILEANGFKLLGYFPLPESCWIENYYKSLENRFDEFLAKHNNDDGKAIIDAGRKEIALYKKYKDYYSYGFYIAQKI